MSEETKMEMQEELQEETPIVEEESITAQAEIELLKNLNGAVTIIGEVATEKPKKRVSKKVKQQESVSEDTEDKGIESLEDSELTEVELVSEKKPVKEIDPDKLVAQKVSRFSHEVKKASKREKQVMYKSEHVVTEFGDEDIETESTKLKEEYLELLASSKSNKILSGKIIGYRYAGEERKSTVLAEIDYGSGLFSVLIPSYLMYDYDVSKYVEPDKLQNIENNLLRRIGSTIKFIVRHVDEKEQTAWADRLLAQSILGYGNYIRNARDGKPRIIKEMIVKAQVLYVVSRGIIVDALGCDITIKKEEISHSYVGDAREELKPGDYVNVRVSNINEKTVEKNGTNYRLVTADGSIKDATINNKKKLFNQFKEGGTYAATITYIEEAGVFCRLKGEVDCLCALPRFGQNPKRGQSRVVRITGKAEDKLFIYGVFVNN